jgi:hypothetical protein
MQRILRETILRLTETSGYKWLLLKVIPYVRFSFYYTSIRGWQYHEGYHRLKPGHILLTNDKWKLTSLLVPGEWTHAALCVGKGVLCEIHEMTHRHFTQSAFFDICKESTRVVILRCTDWDEAYIIKVIEKSWSFTDVPYDTSFLPGPKALGCSELIYEADVERRLLVDTSDLLGLGMPYVTPDDIRRARNVEVVWDSDSTNKQERGLL